jgi:predicted transcriptional regulator
MKSRTLTIRIDAKLDKELDRAASDTGRSRGDLVRDALRSQLSLLRFEKLRAKVLPFAEAAGLLTDEDVFRKVS